MEIGSTAPTKIRFSDLSQSQQIDMRIEQVFEKQDRNLRRDLLRANLAFKSSLEEMKRLVNQGERQKATTDNASTESRNSLGTDAVDLDANIVDVPELSNIVDGSFKINGVSIDVDVENESLNDILTKIQNSGTGVSATYDNATKTISLDSSNDFSLSNGSANFFKGIDVSSGEISAGREEAHANFYKNAKFTEAFKRFTSRLNDVFATLDKFQGQGDTMASQAEDYLESLTDATKDAIQKTNNEDFSSETFFRLKTGFTLSFNGEDFASFSEKEFQKNIVNHYEELEDFFNTRSESGTEGGFLEQINGAINTMNTELEGKIASYSKIGLLVDTIA